MNQPLAIEELSTDVLVLGGGLAGYRAAAAAHAAGSQVVMAFQAHGASQYIIGFNVPIAHANPADSPQAYFDDMVKGGYRLNDRQLVDVLANGAESALAELVSIGVPFAMNGDKFAQRHLSGNTYARSVYHPQGIGHIALNTLKAHCSQIGVSQYAGWKVISLLKDQGEIVGALLANRHSSELLAIHAKSVVMAMGGIGALYSDSTYPADVSSDSYALAIEAGASLIDMEFVQFEPTVVVYPEGAKGMEMPTAMLGDGAHLLNALGERFMYRYNPVHGELQIEKSKMALYIQQEIDEGRGLEDQTVLFDTTQVPADKLETYINHCKRLRSSGLDPIKELPRIRPAAHSHMGGIKVDKHYWTGVPGLFAAGEASSGIHGASRIAGNGASDVIVSGGIAGRSAAMTKQQPAKRNWNKIHQQASEKIQMTVSQSGKTSAEDIKQALRSVMLSSAGLLRNANGLLDGQVKIRNLQSEIDVGLRSNSFTDSIRSLEAKNMVLTGEIIIQAALTRLESRGAHQRTDYPLMDDLHFLNHIAFNMKEDGCIDTRSIPIA